MKTGWLTLSIAASLLLASTGGLVAQGITEHGKPAGARKPAASRADHLRQRYTKAVARLKAARSEREWSGARSELVRRYKELQASGGPAAVSGLPAPETFGAYKAGASSAAAAATRTTAKGFNPQPDPPVGRAGAKAARAGGGEKGIIIIGSAEAAKAAKAAKARGGEKGIVVIGTADAAKAAKAAKAGGGEKGIIVVGGKTSKAAGR
jgi:hypothetical protein